MGIIYAQFDNQILYYFDFLPRSAYLALMEYVDW